MKTKNYLLILIILALASQLNAQSFEDLIITKQNDTIECNITLINESSIFYDYQKKKKTKSTYISKNEVLEFHSDIYKESEATSMANDTLPEPDFYSFPLGCRFQLKLQLIDEKNLSYEVENFEPFQEIVDLHDNDSIFRPQIRGNTMEFIFCISSRGEAKEDGSNLLTTLYIRNNTEYYIDYKAEILIQGGETYKETSVLGIFSGIKSTEMWPYPIDYISLDDFEIKQ